MSNPDKFIVGQFKLHNFIISLIGENTKSSNTQIDIQDQVASFNIVESITKGYVSGSFKIVDTNNIVQNFPINGEEKLTIIYEDWFGVKMEEEFFIYSVVHDEMMYKKSDAVQSYTFYFCSIGRLLSSTQLVRKGFNSSVSDAAKEVFNTYIKQLDSISTKPKEFVVEDSSGVQRLVIPAYSPIDALHFLSRNAYGEDSTSTFRFFESRECFWFASIEKIIDVIQGFSDRVIDDKDRKMKGTFFVSTRPENSIEEETLKMFQIQGLKYLTRVNTIADMDNGNYKRRVIELDILNKEVTKKDVDLIDDGVQYFQNKEDPHQSPRHGRSFVDNVVAEPYDVFILKDWSNYASDLRPNPNNKAIAGIKNMQLLNDKTNDIEIVIYGRNNLFAGSIVELELPMFQTRSGEAPKIDEERSGKYFITSINNEFSGSSYYQTLSLTRFGQNNKKDDMVFEKIPRITPDEQIQDEPYYGAGSPQQTPPNTNNLDSRSTGRTIYVDTPSGRIPVTPPITDR